MRFAQTDLHLHLDGSLPPATVLRLAREQGLDLPGETQEELASLLTVPQSCQSLADYLACFSLPLRVLQTASALREATADLLAALRAEGLSACEIRFAPQLHRQRGLRQTEAVEAVLEALEHAGDLHAKIILCMMTTGDMAENAQTAALTATYHRYGVCGLDLAGQEGARPLKEFAPFFAQAVQNSVGVTIHAGEACGADSVAAALDLGATRIGHGTRVIEDEHVLRRVIDGGVTLEQCVTSNVQTRCAESVKAHPIRQLFDAGVRIAVCTDNRTVSGTTLTQEYQLLQTRLGFTDAQCSTIAEYAKQALFSPVP